MSSGIRDVFCALSICALLSCGGKGSPPQVPTGPPPDPTIANVAGNWTGSLESSSFGSRTISAVLTQTGVDCVDGGWRTEGTEMNGAISGFAQPNHTFSGFVSVEGSPGATGLCLGVFTATGSAAPTGIKWTWVNPGNCAGGVQQTVTFKLSR
jgi:hypothetical protein